MSKLLYIHASPRGERSYAIRAADAFVEAYQQHHPGDNIQKLNVFTRDLPVFDGLAVQAKYTILHGKQHTAEELTAWRAVEAVIDEFKAADKYILAVPMWNFGIPYRLKQYIDILVQPGYTFTYSPEAGYKGLMAGKPVFVAYSRGGAYSAGTGAEAFDLQTKYLELILQFMGFTEVRSLLVEPTLMAGPDTAKVKLTAAMEQAGKMAREF
jgi:FMN-dependent NADH-azoreductase